MLYRKKIYILIFALPFMAFAVTFLFYPAAVNVYNSFFRFMHKLDTNPSYIGLQNLEWLFGQKDFWTSLKNTGILIAFVIVFQVGVALVLALLVNRLRRGQTVFRIIYFMPIVVSATAIGLLYLLMIQPEGLFTKIIGKKSFDWLPNKKFLALATVMAPVIWQYIGYYFVIFLTGLAGIPEDMLEAARIDGASEFQSVTRIMLPMLWNVFRICMVLAIIGALKVFDMPHVIARNGAPGLQTIFMGTYNNYLYNGDFIGESAAYSVIIVVVGIGVSLLSNAVLRENKDIEG